MLKSILKAVFPRPFLKKAFLVGNKIKIGTVDKILFPELKIDKKDFLIYREVNPFLKLNIDQSKFLEEVRNRLAIWTDPQWSQDEYLLEFNSKGFLEPKVGWGITMGNKLLYPSIGFSRAPHVHKPSVIETFFGRKKVVKLGAIISLRDTGEENYFHFFNDVIAKLYFIRDAGFDLKTFTIVLSRKLWEKEYFKLLVQRTWLKGLKYHVQTDEWIEFDKAVFCKPLTHTIKYFNETVELLRPEPSHIVGRRIFITRDAKTLRYIENMEAVLPVLQCHGFEVIDSATLSFADQVKLFSECELLAGVHGAGLTNMIFRKGQRLSVLEIVHPFEYLPFHYIMLSKQLNYQYGVILGKKGHSNRGGFRVEASDLNQAIKNLLNQ